VVSVVSVVSVVKIMFGELWSRHNPMVLSVLSGVLLTLAFPRPAIPATAWVALVPLLLAVRGKSVKAAFRLGFWCGLVHFLTALYWIYHVMAKYGGLPMPVAVLVLLLLGAYLACYPACFAALAAHWEKYPGLWLWGLPLAWVGLEWLRAHMITGFPWANLGYSQTPLLTFIQIADVTGVYGLSWLLVLANTCLARAWIGRRPHWGLLVVAALVVSVGVYGKGRLESIDGKQRQGELQGVALVQGNIDQSRKWDPAFQEEIVSRYLELSRQAVGSSPHPSLLVWPETAAPFFFGLEDRFTPRLQELAQTSEAAMLLGAPGVARENDRPRYYNRVFLMDARGKVLGSYAKQHLVPFGEYVPLPQLLFFVQRLVEAAGDFSAGVDARPLSLNGQRYGVLICYEAIFPDLARTTVRLGANVLVSVTNDAWFGNSGAPYQHLEMARWRAIENRVPLIRCANTGISTVFEATGRNGRQIPLNESGYLVCGVTPLRVPTLYNRYGDWFAWLCSLTALLAAIYTFVVLRRKRI
jgi:apolipoprotein N-acyltransferase